MSINALTSKDTDKGRANLCVNTLTVYNGIFGDIYGDHTVENLHVTGTLEVDGLSGFKEDVLMDDVLLSLWLIRHTLVSSVDLGLVE